MSTRIPALLLPLSMALASCGDGPPPAPPPPPVAPATPEIGTRPSVAADGPPVLVLAIDGVGHDLLKRLAAEGKTPFLARLAAEGTLSLLPSDQPMLSPRLWNTIATGTPPEEHGVTGFTFRQPGTYQTILAHALLRLRPAFWDVAGRAGAPVVVVNWLTTYPALPVNGAIVSGELLARWRTAPRCTYPEDLADRLLREVDASTELRAEADAALAAVLPPDPEDASLMRQYVERDRRAALVARLLVAERRPRLATVYFAGIDVLGHLGWQGADGGPGIAAYYGYVDRLASAVADAMPAESSIVVLSDHGMRTRPPGAAAEVDVNRVLERLGLLAMAEGRIDFAATKIYNLDERYSPEKPLFANVAGREPQGTVQPAELTGFLDGVARSLRDVRTEDGVLLFASVGPPAGETSPMVARPDLVATVNGVLAADAVLVLPGAGGGEGVRLPVADIGFPEPTAAVHDPAGIVIVRPAEGAGIVAPPASLREVAATVLSLAGVRSGSS